MKYIGVYPTSKKKQRGQLSKTNRIITIKDLNSYLSSAKCTIKETKEYPNIAI